MPPTPPPLEMPPQFDAALHWRQIEAEWAKWWVRPTLDAPAPDARPAMPSFAPFLPAAGMHLPPALASGMIDPRAVLELNARFQPRLRRLWEAASAAADPSRDGPKTIPEVAASPAGDRRFQAPEWSELPYFALVKQSYLLAAEYLTELAALAPLPDHDRHRLEFMTRQLADAMAPTNFPATNPDVIRRAVETEGRSLVQGANNLVDDARKGRISMSDEAAFEVGRNLAITPGSVVFRNQLIELIQYDATTPRVHRRPLLIVPPCINKYYILDLQPENSFVRWAVGEGHTVFLVSWRNIPKELGAVTWDDYLEEAVLTAIEVVKEISESPTINALGFCVGGTLLSCALAVLAARRDRSVESTTLLTTMLDFADPGEIGVFISRELLAAREPALAAGQRVHGSELASAFASLRANDLVWNYVVNNYLKGETPPAFDLLHWNGDSSNLPGPMYVYYLKNLYLENRLREPGALTMAGEKIDLSQVKMPTYVLAAREDHIVPWRSAYRTTGLYGGDVTFVLGASGHIAGVVNPAAKNRRNYWTNTLVTDDADDWLARAESRPGSWWPHWSAWLAGHGGAMQAAPSATGSRAHPPIERAPGTYVREASG